MKFRSYYDYGEPEQGLSFVDSVDATHQSFKDECDINVIVRRNGIAQIYENMPIIDDLYADITSIPDFHTAQNVVLAANDSFAQLSPDVRSRFADVSELLDFLSDERNRDEAESLGLTNIRQGHVKDLSATDDSTPT